MKRADLIRHIETQGCVFVREGGKHTVYRNPPAAPPRLFLAIAKSRNIFRERFATIWELPDRMRHSSDK